MQAGPFQKLDPIVTIVITHAGMMAQAKCIDAHHRSISLSKDWPHVHRRLGIIIRNDPSDTHSGQPIRLKTGIFSAFDDPVIDPLPVACINELITFLPMNHQDPFHQVSDKMIGSSLFQKRFHILPSTGCCKCLHFAFLPGFVRQWVGSFERPPRITLLKEGMKLLQQRVQASDIDLTPI